MGCRDGRNGNRPAGRREVYSQICGRTDRACAGCYPNLWQRDYGPVVTSDPHRADRIHDCPRSGGRRLRRQPVPTRRQRHRFHRVRIRPDHEMLELLKRDRAKPDAMGNLRDQPLPIGNGQFVAGHSGAISRVDLHSIDVEVGENERAIAAFARFSKSGLIVDGELGCVNSWRSDHHTRWQLRLRGLRDRTSSPAV